MRLKIIIPVLVLGALVCAVALLLRPAHRAPRESPVAFAPEAAPAGDGGRKNAVRLVERRVQAVRTNSAVSTNAPGPGATEASHRAYVEGRVAALQDLGMDNEPASLEIILGELNSRDAEIRKAAVDAAMQFGSREAIPRLKEAANQTEDPQEKVALLEAIEFLKLPSITELSGQAKGATKQ